MVLKYPIICLDVYCYSNKSLPPREKMTRLPTWHHFLLGKLFGGQVSVSWATLNPWKRNLTLKELQLEKLFLICCFSHLVRHKFTTHQHLKQPCLGLKLLINRSTSYRSLICPLNIINGVALARTMTTPQKPWKTNKQTTNKGRRTTTTTDITLLYYSTKDNLLA